MKKSCILVICFMFISISTVYGQPYKTHNFEVGTEISWLAYREPGVMKERGIMYGIVADYSYHKGIMFKIDGKYSYGRLNYSGSLQDGTPLSVGSIPNYMLEFRGVGGYDINLPRGIVMTPYIGVGSRFLSDNMQKKSPAGYKRESNYLYSPIGLETNFDLCNGWFLGNVLEYDLLWWGHQKSRLSDVDYRFNSLYNHQSTGWGARGSLSIQKRWEKFSIKFGPYIKYWCISTSDTDTIEFKGRASGSGVEPNNRSREIGGSLTIMF